MRYDSRLSGVIHLLLHLAEQERPVSSAVLARAMDTNAVVVRRVLAGLRKAGYVRAERGAAGGWTLATDLGALTLRDVYEALGAPTIFAIGHRAARPRCPVEQVVNGSLERALDVAESRFLESLAEVTLENLQMEFRRRARSRGVARVSHDLWRHHG